MTSDPGVLAQEYEMVALDRLRPHPANPRRGDVGAIGESVTENGFYGAIVAQRSTGYVLAGNHRMRAAEAAGITELPVVWVDVDDDRASRILLVDNRANDLAGYDTESLIEILQGLDGTDEGLLGSGYTNDDLAAMLRGEDPDADEGGGYQAGPTLMDRFLIAPFTVLDARSGWWRTRKREWLAMGIESELGRDEKLVRSSDEIADPDHYRRVNGTVGAIKAQKSLNDIMAQRTGGGKHAAVSGRENQLAFKGGEMADPSFYAKKRAVEKRLGITMTGREFLESEHYVNDGGAMSTGTSIFDPVLCELIYRWFSPSDGRVLDPFAGGSVRGVVASRLGRGYDGIELRPEQIEANRIQAARIVPDAQPGWILGDAAEVLTSAEASVGDSYDLVFTCPPYADLERYSDDPRDLSTMKYPAFLEIYRRIIAGAIARLAPDRFAAIVVGEVRGSDGIYRGFVPDTIRAFEDAGARLYNEAVLVTAVGSLPVRAGRVFSASRKLGKTHQTVLVFVKGDPGRATRACGEVEVAEIREDPEEGAGPDIVWVSEDPDTSDPDAE